MDVDNDIIDLDGGAMDAPMGDNDEESSDAAATSSAALEDAVEQVQISKKTGKPKKRVSWAPDDKLEMVKVFIKDSHHAEEEKPEDFQSKLKEHLQNERAATHQLKKHQEEEWRRRSEEMKPSVEWNWPASTSLLHCFLLLSEPPTYTHVSLGQSLQKWIVVTQQPILAWQDRSQSRRTLSRPVKTPF
jgi:hypothetical protein